MKNLVQIRILKPVYILAVLLSMTMTACKKWLDTPAPLQVDEKIVFSSEQGFKEILNGVYLQIGGQAMYGRDMSYGLLSVVGRSYDTTISPAIGNLYYQGAQYNFQHESVKTVSKAIWDSAYLAIANINYLLDNIDSHKDVFTGNNYNTIKGEALGLRAFLHFELLRLFASSPATGLSIPAIRYLTHYSPYPVAVSNIEEVLNYCIADLSLSANLLNESDLNTSRFTIWATRGLLARVYLYKGDVTNALLYAKAIINSGKFPLAVNNSDLMFAKEHLLSLYTFQNNITQLYKTVFNTPTPLGFSTNNQNTLFVNGSGSANDWRRAFIDPSTGSSTGNTIMPRKFNGSTNTTTPLIRMTEMYYIAAECAAVNNPGYATDLLDTVRAHRNLPKYGLAALPADSLNKEIQKEYQKEFLGEGQMFFYYKRKNLPFAALPFTKVPVVANASYVFIKPE
jgi:hypothetical protein